MENEFDIKITDFNFLEEVDAEAKPVDYEAETKEELSDILQSFKSRAKDEAEAKKQNVSTEYWFAVYFANQEQRDVLLSALRLIDKMQDQYISGDDFAASIGVDIPKMEISTPKAFRKPAGAEDIAMDFSFLSQGEP